LRAVERERSMWVAFQILRRALGPATFREAIREAVRPAETAEAPPLYKSLWRLKIRGLINLNIDRLATKAYVLETGMLAPLEFTGIQGTKLAYLLKEPRPFILNIHGIAEDWSTWVFTQDQLNTLMGSDAYRGFVHSCLASHTVLFMGITADDQSVGGHLEALSSRGIDVGTHFWVTSRTDPETDRWAENAGMRVIRYQAEDEDHSAVFEMFQDLLTFVPPEDPLLPRPVVSEVIKDETPVLPDANDLSRRDAEEIRRLLNSYAKEFLKTPSAEAYDTYMRFCKEYDEAIYRAWYTSTVSGSNILLGYQLLEECASGAFGTVYRAVGHSGEELALKILHQAVRTNSELLQAFRRGVRSMRILAENDVEGMVAYRDASEIPAFVVMDWIDGPTVQSAAEAGLFEDWYLTLRVARDLADILRTAHSLPQRVLHRDLRPSNVMLKDFYARPDEWKVVVLDFDLSWHRGAIERSVIPGSALLGYLAPEQIRKIEGVSTRSAAVDSYGFGMTLFYMISARHPIPAEHRHKEWPDDVLLQCTKHKYSHWSSLPARVARLILNTTRDRQAERWDLTQVKAELDRLLAIVRNPSAVDAADIVAEELVARTEPLSYSWDDNSSAAAMTLPSGVKVKLGGDAANDRIWLEIDWAYGGTQAYKKVGKWIGPAASAVAGVLDSSGWRITAKDAESQMIRIRAQIDSVPTSGNLDHLSASVRTALRRLALN
jgi:serine/threonine protein kinase